MKYIIKILIILGFVGCFAMQTFAIEEETEKPKVFTMEDCINYAIEHDYELKVARENVNVYKSKLGQAKSDYFPTLGLGTGYNFVGNKTGSNPTKTDNEFEVNASVNQLIWDFGKTTAKINMNKYNLQSKKYDLDFAILVAIYYVKTSYYNVLATHAYVDVSKKTLNINELNYERMKALYEAGLNSKIDVVNAEVNCTNSKIQLIEAEQKYKDAKIQLADAMNYTEGINFVVTPTDTFNFKPPVYKPQKFNSANIRKLQNGDNPTSILTSGIEKTDITKDFVFKPNTIGVKEAFDIAMKNRPDLKSLELVVQASEESLKEIKRTYYPKLNASAGYGFERDKNNPYNNFRIYAGLDVPSLNIMNVKYKIDEGKSLLYIANENVKIVKNEIYFDVQHTYTAMEKLEKKIPQMAQRVAQTLENFELADGRYTVGLGNFIELQDAQVKYNTAQLEFVKVVFEYNVAREEFLKVMGVQ